MSDSLESGQRSAPEPEDVARVKTVLVVDDVESERIAIRTAIESRTKFRVCGEASNGVEAIKQAKELRPDLVLMDLASHAGYERSRSGEGIKEHDANGSCCAAHTTRGLNTWATVLSFGRDACSLQRRRLGPTASLP